MWWISGINIKRNPCKCSEMEKKTHLLLLIFFTVYISYKHVSLAPYRCQHRDSADIQLGVSFTPQLM